MSIKKLVIRGGGLKDDHGIIPDLSNIETNIAAQEYLIRRSKEVSLERLFEEIYQNRQDRGTEMMRRRAMRREHDRRHRIADEASFLDTSEKEQIAYDRLAKEDTLAAMAWLRKIAPEDEQEKKSHNKTRSIQG